jgi:hypothetical protein
VAGGRAPPLGQRRREYSPTRASDSPQRIQPGSGCFLCGLSLVACVGVCAVPARAGWGRGRVGAYVAGFRKGAAAAGIRGGGIRVGGRMIAGR